MPWTTINNAIHTVLSGVSGVGQVHKFRRLATNDAQFKTLYSSSNLVNAWEISRTSVVDERRNTRTTGVMSSAITHTFTLYGYYGIADASSTELTFQQLIEDIAEAFRGNVTLSGSADWTTGVSALLIERREFYDLGVHYAELSIDVTEYIDP